MVGWPCSEPGAAEQHAAQAAACVAPLCLTLAACCPPPRRRSLNKCGAISPRYDIAAKDIEAWVGRLLPSRQFGHIILTTSQGIMDHEEARCVRIV